jgi:transposase InsO family protein
VTDGLTALGVANIYFHDIFPLHGIPKKIISDQGPQFASRIMRSILKRLGVDAGLTTAYHPQANGQTERKNQEIEQYLRMFIDTRQDDWTETIPMAEFVLNSHVSSTSGHTPFELLYGYTPDFTVPARRPLYMPAADS